MRSITLESFLSKYYPYDKIEAKFVVFPLQWKEKAPLYFSTGKNKYIAESADLLITNKHYFLDQRKLVQKLRSWYLYVFPIGMMLFYYLFLKDIGEMLVKWIFLGMIILTISQEYLFYPLFLFLGWRGISIFDREVTKIKKNSEEIILSGEDRIRSGGLDFLSRKIYQFVWYKNIRGEKTEITLKIKQ